MKIIIGLGKTGVSCLRYFQRKGETVMAVDTRDSPPNLEAIQAEFPSLEIITGKLPEKLLLQADALIVSPGISLKTPAIAKARAQGVPCLGDIELFAGEAKAPIIAITGSNGKTTLTTLVGKMLADAGLNALVCGNIGVPVLDRLADPVPDYYVMELSSFQLETTQSLRAKVAVLLNLTADHMDRYKDITAYLAAKQRIYQQCETAVLNADAPLLWQSLALPAQQCFFSATDLTRCDVKVTEEILSQLPLQGAHHRENAVAALTIGHCLGLALAPMLQTLSSFTGLAHRCQKIATLKGVDWYNDSKATNVGATIAALTSLHSLYKHIILIAGGDAKGADLSDLKPAVKAYVSQVILLGQAADELQALLQDEVACLRVDSLQAAVQQAAVMATAETVVLLSPACASWDMFDNYQQRGDVFVQAVREVIHEKGSAANA